MNLGRVVALLLLALVPLCASAASRTALTAQDSIVLLPEGGTARGAVILLPFTGGDAQRLLSWRYAERLPALARELGLIIVIPRGSGGGADYATGEAWNRTLQEYSYRIAADADEMVREQGVDARRIVLAGYSMGGDLAWALSQRDPERYAGAIVMGSRASYRAKGALERLATRGFRYFLFMGEREAQARIDGMQAARVALQRAGVAFENGSAAEDHIPAPPEVFERALRYVTAGTVTGGTGLLPLPPPPGGSIATATILGEAPPACALKRFLKPDDGVEWAGYRDAGGKVVIPTEYSADSKEFVGAFAEAWHYEKGHGHLDCTGRFIVDEEFGPQPFSEGLARMRDRRGIGYVNYRGERVIAGRYDGAGRFCGGVAQVGQNCQQFLYGGALDLDACEVVYFIDRQGRRVAASARVAAQCETPAPGSEAPLPRAASARGAVAAGADEAEVEDEAAEEPEAEQPSTAGVAGGCDWHPYTDLRLDAFPSSRLGRAKNVGFKDAAGRVMVSPRYTEAEAFDEGLAAVYVDHQAAYLDCQGRSFEVLYDEGADVFSEDLVRYTEGEAMGYRDRRGQVVIPARYGYGSPFCEGIARVGEYCRIEREDGDIVDLQCSGWHHIDRQGKTVKAPEDWSCGAD